MANNFAKKSIKILFLGIILVLLLADSQTSYSQDDDVLDARVEAIMSQMTTEEKVGQLFMVYWLETTILPNGLLELISDYKVGSVLILETNFLNGYDPSAVNRVASLTNRLQTYNSEQNIISTADGGTFVPLLLAVDHEGDGARLTRIRDGMTPLPSQLSIGATWSPEHAESIGEIVGSELNAIGINLLLGPVVDVLDEPYNKQGNLDIRVFGGDPQWVGEMGRAYIRGVHQGSNGEMITVAKHFPGHGDSNRATDEAVAITGKSFDDLLEVDLVPFIRVTELDENDPLGRTEAIMSSHIAIADTGIEPISLYDEGLTQLINGVEELNEWHTNGFVVADSLGVGALRNKYGSAYDPVDVADKAFRAGNDLLILHNIIPNDGKTRTANDVQLEAFAQTKRVVEYFVDNYNDPFYKPKIDEAVRKIIRAKLQLYPDMTLDAVLVDETLVDDLTGTDSNYEEVTEVANESTSLIYPSDPEAVPPPISNNDNIVFVVQNFRVSSCSECGEAWLQHIDEEIVDFLIGRNFSANKIDVFNYYREGSNDPAGISTFLYGNPDHTALWGFPDPTNFPIDNLEIAHIKNKLRNADWVVFLFIAGDCGPNANKPSNRCNVGFGESDTLDKFLYYAQYDKLDANIAALSFGAPPWKLDTTHVNQLDLYYGIFSQIEPFHEQAARVLLGENDALGHSPIEVVGANYLLEEVLSPDPDQQIVLDVVDEAGNVPRNVGETIELEIADFVDQLGNPILDDTLVEWEGNYDDGVTIEPISFDNWTTANSAKASFVLENPGQVDFSAKIGGVESLPLPIEVLQPPTPTASFTPIPQEEGEDESHTPTPTDTALVQIDPSATPTPSSTSAPPLLPTQTPTFWESLTEDPVDFIGLIIIPALALLVGIIGLILKHRKSENSKTESSTLELDTEQTIKLYNMLDNFSEEELRTLCFELGVTYEDLPASGRINKARELVTQMERNGRLDELESEIRKKRPHLFPDEGAEDPENE